MLDAAISPDGKQMAVVANFDERGRSELLIAKPDDFLLADAKDARRAGLQGDWRPDGHELVVVAGRRLLHATTGELVRLPVADPTSRQSLRLDGDNPSTSRCPLE